MATMQAQAPPKSPKPYNPLNIFPAPSAPNLSLSNDSIQPLNASKSSAPPITNEELQMIEDHVNILKLTVATYVIEYKLQIIQNDLIKTDITKCDEQCQEANQSIESNTVDDFLKKINDIFNK